MIKKSKEQSQYSAQGRVRVRVFLFLKRCGQIIPISIKEEVQRDVHSQETLIMLTWVCIYLINKKN